MPDFEFQTKTGIEEYRHAYFYGWRLVDSVCKWISLFFIWQNNSLRPGLVSEKSLNLVFYLLPKLSRGTIFNINGFTKLFPVCFMASKTICLLIVSARLRRFVFNKGMSVKSFKAHFLTSSALRHPSFRHGTRLRLLLWPSTGIQLLAIRSVVSEILMVCWLISKISCGRTCSHDLKNDNQPALLKLILLELWMSFHVHVLFYH